MDVKTIIANNVKPLVFEYFDYLKEWEASGIDNYSYAIWGTEVEGYEIQFRHDVESPQYIAKNVPTIEEAMQLCNAHHKARILKEYF